MTENHEVLFNELHGKEGNLGIITLNRPDVLNSLNHSMIHSLYRQLVSWSSNHHIKAVVIKAAEGRAFCAGGDLRHMYDRAIAHDPSVSDFFRDEYRLNQLIFHYPKPYIALLNGITMGGGVGISLHGSHVIATDRLSFAMPETGIGFYPDVGGTYFLPRLPHRLGIYIGLTGIRLSCDDCVRVGLVDVKVKETALTALVDCIAQSPFGEDANKTLTSIMDDFREPLSEQSSPLAHPAHIEHCFSAPTVEEIIQAATHSGDTRCLDAVTLLAKKSPTSLRVTLCALQKGGQLDFDACMKQEYRMTCHFLKAHDFLEGIRALIIDKDQRPHWQPETLQKVSQVEVNHYFSPLDKELV